MTSVRDLLAETVGVGETVTVSVTRRRGQLLADHPRETSPFDIVVVENTDLLEEQFANDSGVPSPDDRSVTAEVEILDRLVDDRVAARVVDVAFG
ncbi:hypothetical protein [Halopiger goleimassiliensis]|uniref:hypothetical protein n=1 Tax=Halopiger goleimassiliensis TaxID=1293048 RepID=UPI000677F22B|nr:hypothetical protein [Halopiger goleimassiliensis]